MVCHISIERMLFWIGAFFVPTDIRWITLRKNAIIFVHTIFFVSSDQFCKIVDFSVLYHAHTQVPYIHVMKNVFAASCEFFHESGAT